MTPLVVLGLAAVGLVVAVVSSSPATLRSRERAVARRRAHVQRHPEHATSADVVLDLLREGLSPAQARLVVERAVAQGVEAPTMWQWIDRFDAQALGLVVVADLSRREMLAHLDNGTLPDLGDLRVLAALNGLVLGGEPGRPAAPAARRRGAAVTQPRLRRPYLAA